MKSKLLYERALITCVLMLIVSIILKLFGVPWFNLDTSIPILNKINDIVMNNEFYSFVYSLLFRCLNIYLIVIIVTKSIRINVLKFITLVILSLIVAKITNASYVSFVVDTVVILLICLDVNRDKSIILEYFIAFAINILYQFISLYIKSLGIHLSYYGLTASSLFMIDYYIMLIITYMFLKKGDITLCGIFHRCGSFLAEKLWRKPTQNSN